jgi:hypothetical protein
MIEDMTMVHPIRHGRSWSSCLVASAIVVLLTLPAGAQQSFKSPEDAAEVLAAAVKSASREDILKVLGADSEDIIDSGDDVADAETRQRFLVAYNAKHSVNLEGDKAALILGPDGFPFPIPLTRKKVGWQFDAGAGRLEILYRRIGQNELDAIQTCLAYVDAQNEYADTDRTGAGPGIYAQRIVSSAGQKDGLYWPSDGNDSPLGELAARASAEGYKARSEPQPYHGYYPGWRTELRR